MPGLDVEVIRHALAVARQRGFAEVELESNGSKFAARLDKSKPVPVSTQSSEQAEEEKAPHLNGLLEIKSPLVGFYQHAKQALEAGQRIQKGEIVAVISALGMANDVESLHDGEVVEVLVSDGDPVQYGQTIAKVRGSE